MTFSIQPVRRQKKKLSFQKELSNFVLKGEVIAAEPEGLVFIRTEEKGGGESRAETIHIAGTWRLSADQTLEFQTKYSGEILEFSGSWQVSDSAELVYVCQRKVGVRKTVVFQSLVFRGEWSFDPDFKLEFRLEGTETTFCFEGQLTKFRLQGGRDVIEYRLGVGFKKDFYKNKETLTFFGKWRPLSSTELGFEMDIAAAKPCLLRLAGSYRLSGRNKIEFILTTKKGVEKPEFSVILSRSLLKNRGEVFLKAATDFQGENFLGIGGRLKW